MNNARGAWSRSLSLSRYTSSLLSSAVIVLVVAALACGDETPSVAPILPGAPTPSLTPTNAAPPISPAQQELASVAGDGALATFIVRLDRWGEAMAAIRTMFGPPQFQPPELQMMLSFPNIEALVSSTMGRDASAINLMLATLDRSRPIVVRAGEGHDDLNALLPVAMGQSPGRLRHVIALPATNAPSLRNTIAGLLAEQCRPEGQAYRCSSEATVQVFEHNTWVLVSMSHTLASSASELLATRPPSGVMRWMLSEGRPFAMHWRAEGLRGAISQYEAEEGGRRRTGMSASNFVEMTERFMRLSSHGRSFDEFGVALRPSPASIVAVAQLTPAGVARFAAHAPPSAPSMVRPVTVSSSYDLAALSAVAPEPFGMSDITAGGSRRDPHNFARAMQTCGPGCALRMLAQPLGFARVIQRADPPDEFGQMVAFVRNPALPPGTIDLAINVQAAGELARDRKIQQFAQSVPQIHLHSQVQGTMWAGTLAREPNSPLDPATFVGASTLADPASVACLDRLARTTVDAMHAMGNVNPDAREAMRQQTLQAASAQAGCVTEPTLAAEAAAYLSMLRSMPLQ